MNIAASTPLTDSYLQAMARRVLESGDYWELCDFWGRKCREQAAEATLADVLGKQKSWMLRRERYPWERGHMVYWVLDGGRCLYVGYSAGGAKDGIRQHIYNRTPLGCHLINIQGYRGLTVGFVSLATDSAGTNVRKLGCMCRKLQIEKREPLLNDRL